MKKLWLFFALVFSLLLCSELSAQNISPQFSELKGMEDNQGNTHLLYRINSYQHGTDYESGSNDIYNLVPGTSIDTIYFYDHYSCGPNIGWGVMIFDYDYWENDLTKFIVSGNYVTCLEPSPFISRFNYENVYTDWLNYTNDIYISKQNDSLVFGLPNIISYDGGFIWDTLNLDYNAISVSSINDSIMFAVNFSYPPNSNLYKTIDRGNIYNVVDTGGFNWQSKFYYDTDGSYIYRTNRLDYPNCSLKGSADQGNAFTWQTVYETSNEFFVCLDESQSGAIYLADGKKIFFSSDYGTTFNLYKELGNRIIGIYKKPNSDKLYTATKYNLYEITNDSITIIKSLSIPEEVLNYYPLAIGNKWIYLETIANLNGFPSTYAYDFNIREVLKDTILSNGKRYFKLFDETTMNDTNYLFERIDSSNGLVYRYNFNAPPAGEEEYLIDNLLAEVNDTILSSRWRAPYSYIPDVIFYEQTLINIFGNYKNKKVFRTEFLSSYSYGLVENFGIDSVFYDWDFDYSQSVLKGCIINGVVYGDTTLTNIDDENIYAPTEFKLEQNYPNPFNPSTKISWQSPISSWQTLKVYDILGNEVATLVNEYRNAGRYEIDFSTTGGVSKLSSGVYFYQLSATGGAGNFVETKKMILLK